MSLPAETEVLEQIIAERADKYAVVQQMLQTVLVVPVDVISDGQTESIAPVTITVNERPNVVTFTRAEGAEQIRDRTQHAATMSGTSLILRLPDDVGLLLFTPFGNVDFDPQLLAAIRADLHQSAGSRPPDDE